MARRIVFFQAPDSKTLGPSSRISFLRCEASTCREPPNVRQVLFKFVLSYALHYDPPNEKGAVSVGAWLPAHLLYPVRRDGNFHFTQETARGKTGQRPAALKNWGSFLASVSPRLVFGYQILFYFGDGGGRGDASETRRTAQTNPRQAAVSSV